jgi:hypothetical protein
MPDNCVKEATPDYEREYYIHIQEIKFLKEENEELRKTIIGLCKWLFVERGEANAR